MIQLNCTLYLPPQKLKGKQVELLELGSKKIKQEVNKTKPNAKVTTPITAALKAFEHLGLKNIAVLTPYPKDVNVTVSPTTIL